MNFPNEFADNNVIIWYKGTDKKTVIFQMNFRITSDSRFILEKDHSLTIKDIKESDADIYVCNVIQPPTSIEMHAKLVILSQLQAQIIQGGRDVTDRSMTYRQNDRIEIECKATGAGSSDVEYIWSANGNRLKSDDTMKIDGGLLVIEKANREHIRVYQCLADNKSDETGHASVTINIQCNFLLFDGKIESMAIISRLIFILQIHHVLQPIDR